VCVVSSSGGDLDELARDLPIRIEVLEMSRDISIFSDFRALVDWVNLLRRERPEILLTATPKASLLGLLAAWVTGVNSRVYYLGGLRLEGADGRRRQLLRLIESLTCAAATRIITNSPSLASRCVELRLAPREKIGMTSPGSSHGVDVRHFFPTQRDDVLGAALGLDSTLPVVGFVGRVTRDKGIDALVGAMGILSSRGVAAQLLVVGQQDESDSRMYLRMLGELPGAVAIVGAVKDIRPYFSLMTVHALPSLREGFPNVVLEASAMSIATITTDATGATDSVIHGETGLIVPAGNSEALANALQRLLGDRPFREQLGTRARSWVSEDFDPDSVVESFLRAAYL
jgi:glycosyltransferase involved in cell wall biosynthesis